MRLAKGEGVAGWVALHGEPQLIRHAENDARFASRVDKKTASRPATWPACPCAWKNRILGVLEVLNKKGGDRFHEREIPTLQAMANLAAVAVESARLYDQMVERARALNSELIQATARPARSRPAWKACSLPWRMGWWLRTRTAGSP